MTHLALAKRLTFASDGTSIWTGERGWRMRMLLAWQRLVRAPKVAISRRRSDMWREGEQHRVAYLSERYKMELHTDEDWADNTTRVRGQRYHWDAEADMQTQHRVSSGAAAVLARRRTQRSVQQAPRTMQSGDSTLREEVRGRKRERGEDDDTEMHTGDSTHREDTRGRKRERGEGHDMEQVETQQEQITLTNTRRGDGLLVYNTQSLRRLEVQLSPYQRQREPFGDG